MTMEWQNMGDGGWDFGEKVRGFVRNPLASIYFDEELDGPEGGWAWMVFRTDKQQAIRGTAVNLQSGIEACEAALKINDNILADM